MERPPVTTGGRLVRKDIPYKGVVAAIRYNNPGAMWPGPVAERYGSPSYGQLNDGDNNGAGNKIAYFPNRVWGAAASMALLATSPNYLGKTIAQGQAKWSNNHRQGLPGWDNSKIITRELVRDPNFVIPFMRTIADYEAGGPRGSAALTPEQWRQAFDLYMLVEGSPAAKPTPVEPSKKAPTKTVATTTATATAAAWYVGLGPYVVGAVLVVGIAVIAYLIWRARK